MTNREARATDVVAPCDPQIPQRAELPKRVFDRIMKSGEGRNLRSGGSA